MRPALTGLFLCLGGRLREPFGASAAGQQGRLGSLWACRPRQRSQNRRPWSGLGLPAGASSSRREAMKCFSSAMAFLDLVDLLAPRQIFGSVELFLDGIVAVVQLAQFDLGLLGLVFLGVDGNVGAAMAANSCLCGISGRKHSAAMFFAASNFQKNAWKLLSAA